MKRSTRKLLLLVMIVLFIVLAPTTVLYSLGYRLDTETWEVSRIGALSIRTVPRDARVTINRTSRGTTPKILRGLIPKEYHVRVEKDQHHAWEKTLTVKPQLVTEAHDIILPPLQLPLAVINETPADDIAFSPSGQYLLFLRDTTLEIITLDRNTTIARVPLPFAIATLDGVDWAPGERSLLLPHPSGTAVLSFENDTPAITVVLMDNVFWGPARNDIVFRIAGTTTRKRLEGIDLTTFRTTIPMESGSFTAIVPLPGSWLIQDDQGQLLRWNERGEILSRIDLPPLLQASQVTLRPDSTEAVLGVVDAAGSTWLYHTATRRWQRAGDDVVSVVPAFDSKKVLLLYANASAEILWLNKEEIQPRRNVGDREPFPSLEPVTSRDIRWAPKWTPHLLSVRDNAVWFSELDSRDKRNTWKLLTLRAPRIWTFPQSNAVYIASGGTVYGARIVEP